MATTEVLSTRPAQAARAGRATPVAAVHAARKHARLSTRARAEQAGALESGELELLTPELAKRAGELLAETGGSNTVGATVIASAAQRGDIVVTGDSANLRELAGAVRGVTVKGLG